MAHSSPRPPSTSVFRPFGLTPAFAGGPPGPRFPDLSGLTGGLPGLGARGGRRGGDAAGLVRGPERAPGPLPARPVGVRPGPAPVPGHPAPGDDRRRPRLPEHPEHRPDHGPERHRGPHGDAHPDTHPDTRGGTPRDVPRAQRPAPRREPGRDLDGGRGPRPAPTVDRGPSSLRGRLAVAAVAAGALATAGHSLAGLDALDGAPSTAELALAAEHTASSDDPSDDPSGGPTGLDAATSNVLPVVAGTPDASAASSPDARDRTSGQVSSLNKAAERAAAQARAAAEAARPDFVKPAQGRFTSGFGARWGTSHRGIDIANRIGTPIVSVGDGEVIEAGPAGGFGQWVRVRLDDGTINVFGHVNRFYVREGQRVRAGEEIAEIGNRGHSTGPHLHFEVWTEDGQKINPLPWLASRGVSVGSPED